MKRRLNQLTFLLLRNPRIYPITTFSSFPTTRTCLPILMITSSSSSSSSTLYPPHLHLFVCQFSSAASFSPSKFRSVLAVAEREKKRHMDMRRMSEEDDEEEEDDENGMMMLRLVDKVEKLNDEDDKYEKIDGDADLHNRGRKGGVLRSFDLHRKLKEHKRLLNQLADAGTPDEFHKLMIRIERFEEKNFRKPFGCSAIQKMVNDLNCATGDERITLLQKLDKAVRVVQCQDAHDPSKASKMDDSATPIVGGYHGNIKGSGASRGKSKQCLRGFSLNEGQNEQLSEIKERDDFLLQKLTDIERKLDKKLLKFRGMHENKDVLSQVGNGNLSEENDAPHNQEKEHIFPKIQGFDVKFIDVYRTSKVADGRESVGYNVILACGNYKGVIGFAKAESSELQIATQQSYQKCFQNLYYIEQHDNCTIGKPVQSEYENTRIFLWPAPLGRGMKGHRLVQTILCLAGFKDIRSKVLGWRNPQNTIKALLMALGAREIVDDV